MFAVREDGVELPWREDIADFPPHRPARSRGSSGRSRPSLVYLGGVTMLLTLFFFHYPDQGEQGEQG